MGRELMKDIKPTGSDVGTLSTIVGILRSPGRGKNGEEGPKQNLQGQ